MELDARDRRRFVASWIVGSVVVVVAFVWLLTGGTFRFLTPQVEGGFYDAQAHALLHGHWDVPAQAVGVEGFVVGGRTYEYFGPVPALLRFPIVAFTHRFDGRLTDVSMLVAYLVMLVAAARLHWIIRRIVRGRRPIRRAEMLGIGLVAFTVASGPALYLGSRAWVYHEAELWGLAFALAAFDFIVRFLVDGRWRRLLGASALATAAFLTRGSVGSGPVVALGLLVVVGLAMRWRPRGLSRWSQVAARHWPSRSRWSSTASLPLWGLVVAVLAPVLLYAGVNFVKFRSAFSVPIGKQVISQFDANRQEALRRNSGQIFGSQFVPTNLLQYSRPDALRIDRLFPWIAFPDQRARIIGNVYFDFRDRSASLPDSAPLIVVLGLAGVLVLVGRRSADRRENAENTYDGLNAADGGADVGVLWVPWLGAVVGCVSTVTIGFIANRYLTDLYPVVLLPALAAVETAFAAMSTRPRRSWWYGAIAGAVLLAAFGAVVNMSLGLWYQRAYGQDITDQVRAGFISFQQHVDHRLHGGPTPGLEHGPRLPSTHRERALFVVGNCDGLYWSDGQKWYGVERTPAVGYHRLDVTISKGSNELPLVTFARRGDQLSLRRVSGNTWVVSRERAGQQISGERISLTTGRHSIDVIADPNVDQFDVRWADRTVFSDLVAPPNAGRVVTSAAVRAVPFKPALCDFLTTRH